MKSKILFCLPTDKLGGAERVALNLAVYLKDNYDYHIEIIILGSRDYNSWSVFDDCNNTKLTYLNASRELFSIQRLLFHIYGNKYDIVYSTHAHINGLLSFLRKVNILKVDRLIARESTVIPDRFSGVKRKIFDLIYCLFYGDQDLLIYQTDYMSNALRRNYINLLKVNSAVIDNPINISYINDKLLSSVFSYETNLFNIVMVGRLVDVKNHVVMLNALCELKKEGRLPDELRLYIIGDGPLMEHLSYFTYENDISDIVYFIGNVDNPFEYMAGADLGVLTSISEGFPNVIIEMMYSGVKNIISTDCSPGLNKMHDITVFNLHEGEDLSLLINKAYCCRCNYSDSYYSQAIVRDVGHYWCEINKSLN